MRSEERAWGGGFVLGPGRPGSGEKRVSSDLCAATPTADEGLCPLNPSARLPPCELGALT